MQCEARGSGLGKFLCHQVHMLFSACIESDAWRRRRAARGEPEDPRGGRQPYVSAEGHTILDLYFGALNASVHMIVCMSQCALELKSMSSFHACNNSNNVSQFIEHESYMGSTWLAPSSARRAHCIMCMCACR